MYKTILFDFDGTLTPSLDLWLEAYRYATNVCGLNLDDSELIERWFYTSYTELCDYYKLPSPEIVDKLVEEGLAQAWTHAELYPLALDLLESCRNAGMNIGMVTSSYRNQVEHSLKKLGIAEYFGAVVTAGDTPEFKPSPAPVWLALDKLKVKAEDTIFVGDYEVDVKAGKAAGTATALFLPKQNAPYYDFEALRATEPDFVFSHYQELMQFLRFA
ncbi:HAD-IA family hydrolase [Candidatus Chlorohelix sp.]|uniref:HAD family hydrolase n=1 Tax=Candidatus Chlorohelix sp. TaxID=3139201 RepID=UPI00304496F7